jgi:hypothetical protein
MMVLYALVYLPHCSLADHHVEIRRKAPERDGFLWLLFVHHCLHHRDVGSVEKKPTFPIQR